MNYLENAYLEGYYAALNEEDEKTTMKERISAAGSKVKGAAGKAGNAVTSTKGMAISGGVAAASAGGAIAIRAQIKKLEAELKKTVNPKKRAAIEAKIAKLKKALVATAGVAGVAGATAVAGGVRKGVSAKKNAGYKAAEKRNSEFNPDQNPDLPTAMYNEKTGKQEVYREGFEEGYYYALEEMGMLEDYEDEDDYDSDEAYLEGYYTALEEYGLC